MSLTNATIEEPGRMSYSSLTSYIECGERWRLERGYGLTSSTWFATVAGSAGHELTEMMDLQEAGIDVGEIPTFKEIFDRMLAEEEEKDILVKPSGKVLKSYTSNGGPTKKDYDWWLRFGPEYVGGWEHWKKITPWTLLVLPDGTPAIELPLEVDIGGEKKLGYIDRVYVRDFDGAIILLDLKFGEAPKGNLQLGDYRVGLKRQYGIEATLGTFWMANKGEHTFPVDLTVYSDSYIDSLYEQAWRGIRSGIFLPNITSLCRACGVKDACRAQGGRESMLYPVRTGVIPRHVSSAEPGVVT